MSHSEKNNSESSLKYLQKRLFFSLPLSIQDKYKKYRAFTQLFQTVRDVPEYLYINNHKKIQIHQNPLVFANIARNIRQEGQTLLREDRLYTLYQALKQLPRNSIVVEVGVYKGGSTKFMSQMLFYEKNEAPIFACDTFFGHALVDEKLDGLHKVRNQFSDVLLADVQTYLSECENVTIIPGDIHTTWLDIPREKPIGLLHLDVDVYPATKFCLERLSPRISDDGFIICDDYGFTTCKGAKEAVDEFCAKNPQWGILHLLTGQALLFRRIQ